MKCRLLSLLLLCSFGINTLQAQNDIPIDYKSYAAHDSTSRKEVKQLKKTDAVYFEEGNTYSQALPGYLSLYKKTPDFKPLNWRIAMCYFHTDHKEKALPYLLACDTTMSPLYPFYLAKAYHFNNDFEKAKIYYQDFQQSFAKTYHRLFYSTFEVKKRQYPFDVVMNQLIAACETGLQNSNDAICYTFENIAVVNKASNELAPLLFSNKKLYFASDRKHDKHTTMQVYEIKYDSSEFIGAPEISTRVPYAPEDSRIPLCEDSAQNTLIYQSMENGGDFLLAIKKKNKIKVKPFKELNSRAREGSACFMGDSTIIFSSTRDKKHDESELYISQKNTKGKWQKPAKVSGNINTSGREEVITYNKGELYFISNGPASMGGFDIFKVAYLGNKQWGEVKNLGAPINTADNDMSYIPLDSTTALYCGVRPEGEGGTDLYKVIISPIRNTTDSTVLSDIDTAFMVKMKRELQRLDSLYSAPDLIDNYDDYNTRLDSLLREDLMEGDSTKSKNTIESLIDSLQTQHYDTLKSINRVLSDSITSTLGTKDAMIVEGEAPIDTIPEILSDSTITIIEANDSMALKSEALIDTLRTINQ